MSLLSKQREKQEFQDKFKTDSSGISKQTGSLGRKCETLIRTYEEPVLPKVARILFISMIVLTVLMIAVDLKNGIPFAAQIGVITILQNLSQSALIMWGIYTAFLVFVCGIGMAVNRTTVRRKAQEGTGDAWTEEDETRCVRSARRLNRPYRRYLLCCAAGVIFFLLLYLISHSP